MDAPQDVIMKLKKKLNEAVLQNKEEHVLKVLFKLAQVPMTLPILQNTQIGKDVNNLRKLSKRVKEESRALVQVWKRLLPPSEPSKPLPVLVKKRTTYVESITSSSPGAKQTTSNHKGCPDTGTSPSSIGLQRSSKPLQTKGKRRETGTHLNTASADKDVKGLDEFSKALLGAPCKSPSNDDTEPNYCTSEIHEDNDTSHRTVNRNQKAATTHTDGHITKSHRDTIYKNEVTTAIPNYCNADRSQSPFPASTINDHHTTSGSTVKESLSTMGEPTTNSRKRKGDVANSLDAVALSKRSRTQVYSGKKSDSGPKTVSSLFDLCMKVLIENTDSIEEVGGVPFYVLEPVLSRCSATQLMRLEEYNPHFIEDGDGLWEKHCNKEFKGYKVSKKQTWRELYIDRLEMRELKLKNLAAKISATEKARKEPIRTVKSTVATMKPGRRSGRHMFHPGMVGRSVKPLEKPSSTNSLMSRTMKMAKERNHMMKFKPNHR